MSQAIPNDLAFIYEAIIELDGLPRIPAGFPSPAEDYYQKPLELEDYLTYNRNSTFYAVAQGESMIGVGIYDGDLLVIDKSLPPKNGDIAVVRLEDEFTVKRLKLTNGRMTLQAANEAYPDIEISKERDHQVWGIVIASVRKFR